jgi:hypothetical protein
MADDKIKTGGQDRIRVAGGQEYEVRDFADKFDISPGEAALATTERRWKAKPGS